MFMSIDQGELSWFMNYLMVGIDDFKVTQLKSFVFYANVYHFSLDTSGNRKFLSIYPSLKVDSLYGIIVI